MVIELGQWLQQERLKQGIDLRTLSEKTGIDIATISRVENLKTQATLASSVRLCEGLGVTPISLLEALERKPDKDLAAFDGLGCDGIPSLSAVQMFLSYIDDNWQAGSLLLADMFNMIASTHVLSGFTEHREVPYLFVPEDVSKLLVDLPLYRFEVVYPPRLGVESIWTIYHCRKWLTGTDVGMYIRKLRNEKRVPLMRLQHAVKISDSVLARLEEGVLERIKMNDVLMLDDYLEQHGKILAMYWQTYQLDREMTEFLTARGHQQTKVAFNTWIAQQERLMFIFTLLSRWSQLGDHKERVAMERLLERMNQSQTLMESTSTKGEMSGQ
jgi:transcriptional regulator with XRE-family HTH domain